MATGNFDSYTIVGAKEDVSDVISNISPTLTPFQTMVGNESIHQRIHQWQEDSLQAVALNAQIEGAAAPTANTTPTVLRNNTTQIFLATAATTGTTDVTKTYGRGKEMAYQLAMRGKELKRNLENALVGTHQALVTGSSGVARTFAGYQAQIASGNVSQVGSSGSPAALTEASILSLAQTIFNAGGEPTTLMVKPNDKLKVTGFKASGRTTFVENTERKITNTVDVYESPFGDLKVVMNRFISGGPLATGTQSDALMFDPTMWKQLVLRNWFRETLAKTGDSTQVMIGGEFSLAHKNQSASGYLTWLS